ncbi:phosphotransferase family protein [Nocardioides acrostichi]|uniref:Phosphotransferase family protein n=1 Tax=Nocardioides acrostichi TaxID=2784339 RepID=A0A930YB64_9ACTN|nr:phosphotransferase family protein [Nocardioides acrostichi]MBF4160179.1 phosphotransferase family protein [Nocardioides acrostichi]
MVTSATPGTPDKSPPPADLVMQRSSRDAAEVGRLLTAWLANELPAGADPSVDVLAGVDANGMSSETLVFDATWTTDAGRFTHPFVARVEPAAADVPVFPRYDLDAQYDAIRLVGELSDVPVPGVGLREQTGSVLGTPFFLMDRVEGQVPPDVLPYNFGDNWFFDLGAEGHQAVQDATVDVLARLHAIADPTERFGFLDPVLHGFEGRTPLARLLAERRDWYEFAKADLGPSPLIERSLAWLEANLPDTDEAVLSWGDSRIGNMMWRGTEPVAVLDWEMASLGPRELDVAWTIYCHQVFESIATSMGLPGMPDFMREADVKVAYAARTGVQLGDLAWYHVLHGVSWCTVFMRTGQRQVRFGEIEQPDDIEQLFHCRALVEQTLDEVGA